MRLTERYEDFDIDDIDYKNPVIKHRVVDHSTDYEEKLGQLEDLEENLGIDLVTLFKAITNGIWVKTKNGISKHLTVALKKRHPTKEYWLFYRPYSHVYLEDYGKTWALTREELEK